MEKINRKIRTLFWVSLGLSVGFPLGVLGIVFGAVKQIVALLVIGIVLAVAGFYVMPIMWIQYGEKRRDRAMLSMILNDHLYTVSAIAEQIGVADNIVREKLKKMILSRELTGFLLINDVLELNTNLKQTARTRKTRKCPGCGANMDFDGVKFVCSYCGTVARED